MGSVISFRRGFDGPHEILLGRKKGRLIKVSDPYEGEREGWNYQNGLAVGGRESGVYMVAGVVALIKNTKSRKGSSLLPVLVSLVLSPNST